MEMIKMNNNEFLEGILDKISINPGREKQIRSVLKKTMTKFGKEFPDYMGYRIKGSFRRSTNIRGKFDIDVNVVGTWKEEKLLKLFYKKVKKFVLKNPEIELMREPPYYHAIPIVIHNDINVDLLAAIDKGNGIYVIPEGYQKVIKTAPNEFEEKLKYINEMTMGMSTKLIRLLKLWNYQHKKVFRSYQIERLVEVIFRRQSMVYLTYGLQKFFKDARFFLENNQKIYDEIKQEYVLD